ncbi:MAG: transcription termination/antitermination protein NusG [Candidatus Dojkabacteria bacterium]|nr:MAG: transcription termination/antitermination protein NusG [Candidatus Dojkabacteria bacterium]
MANKKVKNEVEMENAGDLQIVDNSAAVDQAVEAPAAEAEPAAKKTNPKCKWYVLSTRTGYENSVSEALKQRVEASGLDDMVEQILVPVQKKIVVKKGKQTVKEEKIFPGYVLIKMELNQNTWSILSNTEGVRGFVKTDKHPRPLPEKEVEAIMKFMEVEQPAYQASFSVGEAVKIVDGEFTDFIGSVKEIDESKGKVKIMITFFGREVPIELEFSQVSKL